MGMKHVPMIGALALAASLTFVVPSPAVADAYDNPPIGGALLGGRGVIVDQTARKLPKTEASAFVVADADTGEVLAAKNPHGRFLPASTLKALTALTLIPKLDRKKMVKPSQDACNQEGSAVGLTPRKIYTVDDLFRALMMVSGNDAAVALAEANGGLPKTLADMNAEARRIQAMDTVAKTPNGLDKPGQSSSAYDLALIARAGLADPAFRKYVGTKVADFPAPKGHYQIANHNRLLGRYPGMLGVKNGWTSKALGSFIGAARRDGHTIIVTVMRHEGSFWPEVQDLLDWGFAARGRTAAVGTLVGPIPAAKPTRPVGGPPTPAPAVSRPADAAGESSSAGAAGVAVIGVAALGGLAWLGYGLRRRRSRGRGSAQV